MNETQTPADDASFDEDVVARWERRNASALASDAAALRIERLAYFPRVDLWHSILAAAAYRTAIACEYDPSKVHACLLPDPETRKLRPSLSFEEERAKDDGKRLASVFHFAVRSVQQEFSYDLALAAADAHYGVRLAALLPDESLEAFTKRFMAWMESSHAGAQEREDGPEEDEQDDEQQDDDQSQAEDGEAAAESGFTQSGPADPS